MHPNAYLSHKTSKEKLSSIDFFDPTLNPTTLVHSARKQHKAQDSVDGKMILEFESGDNGLNMMFNDMNLEQPHNLGHKTKLSVEIKQFTPQQTHYFDPKTCFNNSITPFNQNQANNSTNELMDSELIHQNMDQEISSPFYLPNEFLVSLTPTSPFSYQSNSPFSPLNMQQELLKSPHYPPRSPNWISPISPLLNTHLPASPTQHPTHKETHFHKCGQCGRKYRQRSGLNYHLKFSHNVREEDKKIITCIYCEKVYRNLNGLKYHLDHSHAEKDISFALDCGRRIHESREQGLRHHSSEESSLIRGSSNESMNSFGFKSGGKSDMDRSMSMEGLVAQWISIEPSPLSKIKHWKSEPSISDLNIQI